MKIFDVTPPLLFLFRLVLCSACVCAFGQLSCVQEGAQHVAEDPAPLKSPEETISVEDAGTEARSDALRVTLSVEGEGTLSYVNDGAPASLTAASGPVVITAEKPSVTLTLEAQPVAGITEFWQWLSSDSEIDQHYVSATTLTLTKDTSISAYFVPYGAITRVNVSVEKWGEGTTDPPPGIYAVPKYAGTDLPCVQACQNAQVQPSSCTACETAKFTARALPAKDWVFWEWGAATVPLAIPDIVAEIPVLSGTDLRATFQSRPGLDGLDLLNSLGRFYLALGFQSPSNQVMKLDIDWGEFSVALDNSLEYEGNGMPDAAEVALLEKILKTPRLDLTERQGTASEPVWGFFYKNHTLTEKDLVGRDPAIINAVAAYMTLGNYGYQRKIAALVADRFNQSISIDSYTTNARQYLAPEEDADMDRATNLEEWESAVANHPSDVPAALSEFVNAAIDPLIFPNASEVGKS